MDTRQGHVVECDIADGDRRVAVGNTCSALLFSPDHQPRHHRP